MKGFWDWLTKPKMNSTVYRYHAMTPEQKAHFDEAFRHMDKAFEALRNLK